MPPAAVRFQALLDELRRGGEPDYALAALNDLLASLAPGKLLSAVADADLRSLSPFLCNYVAAMVELAADRGGGSATALGARRGAAGRAVLRRAARIAPAAPPPRQPRRLQAAEPLCRCDGRRPGLTSACNLTTVEDALAVVTRYFDASRLPAKTRLALEELLGG